MKAFYMAVAAEFAKLKRHPMRWISFAAFSLAPLMGAMFIIILSKPVPESMSALSAKARLMSFDPDWPGYVSILSQAVGVGGVLVFGFVASWVFGREYTDRTAKDLLALPVARSTILNAKFLFYAFWCAALALSNLVIGFIIAIILQLDGLFDTVWLPVYVSTTLLVTLLGTVASFFALSGKGYLAPLGFVAFVVVLGQIVTAVGYGAYFPWAIPALYSGAGGPDLRNLSAASFAVMLLTGLIGYCGCLYWWNRRDQV